MQIGNWGTESGVETHHLTGSKEEIYKIIDEIRMLGFKFAETPIITRAFRAQYIVILKLIPPNRGEKNDKHT